SDGRKIADAAARSKSVLILGAGFIGMEVAASLCQRGLEVHVAAPEKVPLQGILGERIGGFLRRIHEEKGVHFHLGTTVGSLEGEPVVEEAVLSDGSRIAVNMVIAGLGIDPVVDYLKGTGLVSDGGVPVDSQLTTQGEGIFAAGDIAIVPHWKTGEGIRVEHWIVAESQGRHAARSMMGRGSPYRDVPVFWTKQYDGSLKYAGYARKVDRIAYRGSVEEGNFTAGFYEDDALKAVATLERIREVIYLSELLKNGENIPFDQFEGFQLK
ncbi:MAG TPA: FAD-dependent oxidoreductase, partial [Spirochaetia bacterium]|nr:FAD-dependent oxidoreductase [Spirochaetia bacterium]